MKLLKKIPLLCLLFLITGSLTGTGRAMAQPGVSVSFQAFYDELAPYGRWIDHRGYGRVWIPAVEADFQPYGTRGHWVMTEYGNTWVSDYDWGWAPFHYGRWVYDDYYGWVWVPGDEWGPAWVAWRSGGGYYGWAPLGPGMDINININIPLLRWVFVPQRYIARPAVYSYFVPRTRVVNVYNHTTVINNIYVNNNRRYFYGPRAHEISRVTRSRVTVHRLDNMDRPGRATASNGSLRMYRPEVTRGGNNAPSSARPGRQPENRRPDNDRNTNTGGNNASRPQRPDRNDGQNYTAPNRTTSPGGNNRPEISRPEREQRPSANTQRPVVPGNQNNAGTQNAPRGNERQRPDNSGDQRNNRPGAEEQRRSQQTSPSGESRNGNENRDTRQRESAPQQRQQRPERTAPSQERRSNEQRSGSSSEKPSRPAGRLTRG